PSLLGRRERRQGSAKTFFHVGRKLSLRNPILARKPPISKGFEGPYLGTEVPLPRMHQRVFPHFGDIDQKFLGDTSTVNGLSNQLPHPIHLTIAPFGRTVADTSWRSLSP